MAYNPQQPAVEKPMTNWDTHLFDCFVDFSTFCYGFWCCPSLACTVSGSFGENYCLPLCDICSPALMTACGIPPCAPPALLSLRAGLRNRYNIKGSLCEDIAVSCFCVWCAWCQLQRELKHRKKNTAIIVNMQPQNVINIQQQGPVVNSQPVFVGQQQQQQPQPVFVGQQQQQQQPQPVFVGQQQQQPQPVFVGQQQQQQQPQPVFVGQQQQQPQPVFVGQQQQQPQPVFVGQQQQQLQPQPFFVGQQQPQLEPQPVIMTKY